MRHLGLRPAPRRLVALALIAAVAIGLGYLRFAPPVLAACVSTRRARRGYDAKALRLRHRIGRLRRRVRHSGRPGELRESGLAPDRRPVTRIRATSPNPEEPIFYLEGGPGLSNMRFNEASRFAPTVTSYSSAIGASTAPFGSTAPRSRRRSSSRPTSWARSPSAPTATRTGPARTG